MMPLQIKISDVNTPTGEYFAEENDNIGLEVGGIDYEFSKSILRLIILS